MSTPSIDILIVEDEPAHAEAIRRALLDANPPYMARVAGSLSEFRQAVDSRQPDLVLLDLLLPDGRSDALLITPPEAGPYPFIVMTSHGDEQVAVSTIRSGALDYVVKSPESIKAMPRIVSQAMQSWRLLQERRQALQSLAMREEIFASVISQSSDAIAIFDAETGRFIEFNTSAHEGLGYTHEQFAQLGIRDFQAEHSPEEIRRNIEQVETSGVASFESLHRHCDGSLRNVLVNIRKLHHQGSDFMAAVWTDITEQKRAEAHAAREARRTEFLLELHQKAPSMTDKELFDYALDCAVELTESAIGFFHQVSEDQNNIILTTWNREALKNCTALYDVHYPIAEAGNWVDCVRQKQAVVYNDFARSPNQQGLPEGHTTLHRFMSIPVMQDGSVRIIFGVGNKQEDYVDADVKQLQVVANEVYKIISQRKSHIALRESEERFRQLVETSSDLIWEVDTAGRYTYISPKVVDLLGYAPDMMIGRTPFDFMSPTEAGRISAMFRDTVAAEKPFSGNVSSMLHKDGHEIMLETGGSPIWGENGELRGYRGVNRNITESRKLEEQLRESQKMEAIGLLAGGVAHDFNNILTIISGYCSLLKMDGHFTVEQNEQLDHIQDASEKAAKLTKGLLAFSRKQKLVLQRENLNGVVYNIQKFLKRIIGEDIRLNYLCHEIDLNIIADASQIEQILLNLATNARDAMPRGGTLTIKTDVQELDEAFISSHGFGIPKRYAVLIVSDTGVGISREDQQRIFEPFFTTKGVGKGTGLGMAIVFGIVKQHNGFIDVYSEPGVGTVFKIYLPLDEATVTGRRETAVQELPRGGSETILVVEDEAPVRALLGAILKKSGYRVIPAVDGDDGIAQFLQHKDEIQLVLLDMIMPKKNGREVHDEMARINPRVKALYVSGYTADFIESRGVSEDGIDLINKPVHPTQLLRKIRELLDCQRDAG